MALLSSLPQNFLSIDGTLNYLCILGSNMPCTPEAVDVLRKANVLIAPAMAAGAGGV